jgi:hypothetical protein
MVLLDAGTFVLFNLFGFGFFAASIKFKRNANMDNTSLWLLAKPFAILSMLAFLILAFWMLQPSAVGITRTAVTTDGITTWNETEELIWISDQFTNFLQWVYFGLSMLALIVFALRVAI